MTIISVAEHLSLAKRDIAAGDASLRSAAEHIAAAVEAGARQADIAATVNKSQSWICRLLAWRANNFVAAGPFADDSKAKRQRAKYAAPNNSKPKKATLDRASRDTLVKSLGMLGSDHDGEVLAAARTVERLRRKFGVTWEQLVVEASEFKARAAA